LGRLPKIVFVNLAVLIGLYLLTEAILHAVSSGSTFAIRRHPHSQQSARQAILADDFIEKYHL
jgi:hypothetical protein